MDRAWALNRTAHTQLASLGRIVALPFAVLAVALLLAGAGWFRHRYWGWVLGVALIATNLAGDILNLILGEKLKGAFGVAIAGLLLLYMTRPAVRSYFARSGT